MTSVHPEYSDSEDKKQVMKVKIKPESKRKSKLPVKFKSSPLINKLTFVGLR
jgi:hypothetical protein